MEELICWIVGGILAFFLLLYVLFELHYFLRSALCVIIARVFKRKIHILDTASVYGICLTNDIDTLLFHMNNARYLRELDFARVDFYERTGLYRTILSKGGAVVQGACTIRYRRFLKPFTIYKIESKIIYWDDKSIFMEHRFVTPKDKFIRAIVTCRQRVIKVNAEDIMKDLLISPLNQQQQCIIENGNNTSKPSYYKPEPPLDLQRWIESMEISSNILRNNS